MIDKLLVKLRRYGHVSVGEEEVLRAAASQQLTASFVTANPPQLHGKTASASRFTFERRQANVGSPSYAAATCPRPVSWARLRDCNQSGRNLPISTK